MPCLPGVVMAGRTATSGNPSLAATAWPRLRPPAPVTGPAWSGHSLLWPRGLAWPTYLARPACPTYPCLLDVPRARPGPAGLARLRGHTGPPAQTQSARSVCSVRSVGPARPVRPVWPAARTPVCGPARPACFAGPSALPVLVRPTWSCRPSGPVWGHPACGPPRPPAARPGLLGRRPFRPARPAGPLALPSWGPVCLRCRHAWTTFLPACSASPARCSGHRAARRRRPV
jgi:hypothetical protein